METALLILVVVGILAYYGLMGSVEKAADMANKEMDYLSDAHEVSVIERTAKLDSKITDDNFMKAAMVKAKLEALRNGQGLPSQGEEA